MSSNNRAYHRPINSAKSSCSESIGRTLLDLIRTRDKVSSSSSQSTANQQLEDDEQEQEITQLDIQISLILNNLSNTISSSNGGLFDDINRAQSFYECASNRSSATTTSNQNENGRDTSGGGGKKRKRNKGGSSNNTSSSSSGLSAISYGIHLDSHSNNQQQSIGSMQSSGEKGGDSLDEGLILTSICKILGVTIGRKKKQQQQQADESLSVDHNITGIQQQQSHRYSYNLICGALNVLLSICNHAKYYDPSSSFSSFTTDNGVTMTCASIELDMISSIGLYLVDGLCDNILYLYYSSISSGNGDSCGNVLEGLVGCFKVCASLVSLLNIKLSKCTKSIANLYDTTWLVLNNSTTLSATTATEKDLNNVQKAGTVLLSTLVLVGNSDGMPQSKIWSQGIVNGITLLKWAVNDFFPIVDNKDQSNRQQSTLWKEHEKWLSIATEDTSNKDEESSLDLSKDDPTDIHRSQALQYRIQVLSSYIHSLLTMDGYPRQQNHMIGINLPLDTLLDISEILLSFPLAAETKHRSTKSRLRSIPIKNGLLSPNSAMLISPSIKLCGHLLLDVTVESTRGAGILSKARRIVGMSVSSLQSSCSLSLVSAVDGNRRGSTSSSSSDRVSKIGIHLRESIPLRMKSIYTFHCVSVSLGSGVMSSTGTVKSMCRALVLLSGCLLEQVNGCDESVGGGDWGTLGERAELVEASSNAIGACIATFGGLIPANVRGTLDSIINTCLSTFYSRGGSHPIFAYSNVKRSMLQLGMNCACVPWGDGGRSSITNVLRTVCTMLRSDSDTSVVSTALATLCACDAFTTPRAPPLLIPTRDSLNDASHTTASSMLQDMKDSKQEILASKEAKEERKKKLDKKSSKKKKAKKDEAATNDDSTLTAEKPEDDAESIVAKVNATKSEEPIANNVPTQSATTSDKMEESSLPPTDKMTVSEDVESSNAEEIDMNEDQEDPISDIGPVETTNASEPMNEDQEEDSNEDDGDSDGSFDFPEIIDGDPDEEDR